MFSLMFQWDSVPRTGLENGYFYMKKGDGPGAFDDWKKVYFVENEDYSIDIYEKEDVSAGIGWRLFLNSYNTAFSIS